MADPFFTKMWALCRARENAKATLCEPSPYERAWQRIASRTYTALPRPIFAAAVVEAKNTGLDWRDGARFEDRVVYQVNDWRREWALPGISQTS